VSTQTGKQPRRPAIDPRIRQRRIEVKRDEGRRRLRAVLALVSVASVLAVALAATHSALLDVDNVVVRGADHTARGDILAAARLDRRRFMVDVDRASVAPNVDRLPWIATTKVVRRWPGTVQLTVRERVAVAALAPSPGTFSLVDATGRVLQAVNQLPPGIFVITGGEAPPAPGRVVGSAAETGVRVAAGVPGDLRPRIASVSLVAGGEVELRLAGPAGPVVRFGSADALPAKMVALSTLVAKANLTGATVIDVRVPSAPVLTRSTPAR
jgi:cell division protein FtsQ